MNSLFMLYHPLEIVMHTRSGQERHEVYTGSGHPVERIGNGNQGHCVSSHTEQCQDRVEEYAGLGKKRV